MKTFIKISILAVVLIGVIAGYEWSERAGVWEGILFPEFDIEKTWIDWDMEGLTTVVFKVGARVRNKSDFGGSRIFTCTFTNSDGKSLRQEKELTLDKESSKKVVFEYEASLGKEAIKRLRSGGDLNSRYNVELESGVVFKGALERIKGVGGKEK